MRPGFRYSDRMTDAVFQRCINPACGGTAAARRHRRSVCPTCGGLLDVAYDWDRLPPPKSLREFEAKWADRTDPLELHAASGGSASCCRSPPPEQIMTIGEGQTHPADGRHGRPATSA